MIIIIKCLLEVRNLTTPRFIHDSGAKHPTLLMECKYTFENRFIFQHNKGISTIHGKKSFEHLDEIARKCVDEVFWGRYHKIGSPLPPENIVNEHGRHHDQQH